MIISLDTETTGCDFVHGAKPFLITTCDDSRGPDAIKFWEWPVNPLTRQPEIPDGDLADVAELLDAADLIYLQNSKFDARALLTIGIQLPWPKVRDTLIMGHLLASNHKHTLTWMCIEYLGVDIEPYEEHIKEVTQACRTISKRNFPHWKLADEGMPGMPSVQSSSKRDEDKPWKNDMWLPQALALQLSIEAKHLPNVPDNWYTACSRYANSDSEHTLYLGLEMERLIRERGLWKIYEHRLHLMRVDCEMECYGVTARGDYTDSTVAEYEQHVAEAEDELVSIAAGYGHKLELAKGASINDNMRDFLYGAVEQECHQCRHTRRIKHWKGESPNSQVCMKCAKRKRNPVQSAMTTRYRDNLALPVIRVPSGGGKKAVEASLNKETMQEYLATTDGAAYDFLSILADKRTYGTALTYMEAYRRFWVPVQEHRGYYRIHASINPCATDHLRQASNSPNMQNVSGESKEISNRTCFGPLPDREWWCMDFKSIERRIPAYESGEPKMIEVFEKPGEAPYWGSLYYLTASILYPDEYWSRAEVDGLFRKDKPALYKRAKFCDLAKQYGCGPRKYNRLAGLDGAFEMVNNEFTHLAALQAKYLSLAEKTGFVETLPDRTVDPTRGYPILASRTEDGRVLSTTPFNYHVSGTACWCKNAALVRCSDQCARWREEGFDAHIILEIHDEIIFDFPRGAIHEENLPKALILKRLMEQSGDDLIPSIPTPVSVSYHRDNWAEGVTCA